MSTQRLRTWLPYLRPSPHSILSTTVTSHAVHPVGTAWQGARPLCFLVLLGILILTACGARTTSGASTPLGATATRTLVHAQVRFTGPYTFQAPWPFAGVEFDRDTPYAVALRSVTDLGLIPLAPCTSGGLGVGIKWQPAGEAAGYATPEPPPIGPSLSVYGPSPYPDPNLPDAPPDWLIRLSNLSFVQFIGDGPSGCPLLPGPAGTPSYLPPNATFTYLRVSFSAATSYDTALAAISNLGFRLADPCYEQANPKPLWHPMGQEQSFAATQTLILSTTYANSTQWHQQLAAVPGVTTIQAPYTASC